jgi:hypothetical protein
VNVGSLKCLEKSYLTEEKLQVRVVSQLDFGKHSKRSR